MPGACEHLGGRERQREREGESEGEREREGGREREREGARWMVEWPAAKKAWC